MHHLADLLPQVVREPGCDRRDHRVALELGPGRDPQSATGEQSPPHLPEGGGSIREELEALLAEDHVELLIADRQGVGAPLQIGDLRGAFPGGLRAGDLEHRSAQVDARHAAVGSSPEGGGP